MLQVIRDRAQGVFAWLIVGAIVLAMGLFGLKSYFQNTSTASQAAIVNGEKVPISEYRIAYQNQRNRMQQMLGKNYDPDLFDAQIKKSALDNVVDNTLLVQNAEEKNIFVSDEMLAQQLRGIGAFQENGQFSSALERQTLAQVGQTVTGFETRIRRGMMADQLVDGIVASSFATNYQIQFDYKLTHQEREVAYVEFPLDKFKNKVSITDDEIKKYYDANKTNYQTPERVQLKYLELSVADLMSQVSVSEDELKSYYDEQKGNYIVPEQRRARHILIEFGKDETKAKAKAEKIYKEAKSGEDFAKLAKKYSDDIGSKKQGGDLGFFGRGIMEKTFDKQVFSMKVGEISKPIKTKFGFHIIKLEAIKPSMSKSLEQVKSELTNELKRKKAQKLYIDRTDKLANLTYETPDSLGPAEEELGLKVKVSPPISKRGGPGIFSNRKIIDAAFSDDVLNQHLNSPAIELDNDKMVVVRLDKHFPAAPRPLEQVKGQIKSELEKEKELALAKTEANTFEEKLKKGESISKPVKEKGYKLKEKTWVKRTTTELPREIITAAFNMPGVNDKKIVTKGITMSNGDYAIIALSGVKDGDVSKITKEDKKQLESNIAKAEGMDEYDALLQSLKSKAKVKTFPENL